MAVKISLSEAKKKKFGQKQFKIIGRENNKLKLEKLLEWLKSKNDFNEATKSIKNIRADTNNVEASSRDKNVFNDLKRLKTDISKNTVNKESVIKTVEKCISGLAQLRQK